MTLTMALAAIAAGAIVSWRNRGGKPATMDTVMKPERKLPDEGTFWLIILGLVAVAAFLSVAQLMIG